MEAPCPADGDDAAAKQSVARRSLVRAAARHARVQFAANPPRAAGDCADRSGTGGGPAQPAQPADAAVAVLQPLDGGVRYDRRHNCADSRILLPADPRETLATPQPHMTKP